jgi:hypothetical protein
MQYSIFDRPISPFGRRLECCLCGAHLWVELSLEELNAQRADPKTFNDWTCDGCHDLACGEDPDVQSCA